MKMYGRIRYLLAEGFDVFSVRSSFGPTSKGIAEIYYRMTDATGRIRAYSEHFCVASSEVDACQKLVERHTA